MNKKLIEELKEKLEKEGASIEKELSRFAKKDGKIKGDWNTVFPNFSGAEAGHGDMEKAADEVEEYSTLLPIEHSLEIKLKNINLALEKIKDGTYGLCEKCKKEISEERLIAFPEAETCNDCK
ncbi:MAG: TraR/DksA family transcriptional regulator [Parcubacteria group bacterium]|nr:MAG: TraR/DksA family transcriptional regulator [Parcubacteria group bacterium]